MIDLKNVCFGCMAENIEENPCPICGWDNTAEPESHLYLKPGNMLNNQYLIGRVLGHGGFGITYLALDTKLKIKLAIKEYLPREYASRDSTDTTVSVHSGSAKDEFAYGLEKFLEEAQNVARFQGHSGIVGVLNFFEANGTGYMVMPYVEGTTLKEYLQSQPDGKIPFDKAMNIFMPVLDALREVHKAGMLHRDISPDNIYITTEGQVKLLDFGAARFAMGEHSKSLSIVLKPGYSPKEQYSSKGKQGPWTDVYAVAASLYRAITGIVPDDALDRAEEDELKLPAELGVDIPEPSQQALIAALSINAKDRTQTIIGFQNSLTEPSASQSSDNAIQKKGRFDKPSETSENDDSTMYQPSSTSNVEKYQNGKNNIAERFNFFTFWGKSHKVSKYKLGGIVFTVMLFLYIYEAGLAIQFIEFHTYDNSIKFFDAIIKGFSGAYGIPKIMLFFNIVVTIALLYELNNKKEVNFVVLVLQAFVSLGFVHLYYIVLDNETLGFRVFFSMCFLVSIRLLDLKIKIILLVFMMIISLRLMAAIGFSTGDQLFFLFPISSLFLFIMSFFTESLLSIQKKWGRDTRN